mmetsp:Transcript_39575/g.101171  ORF Transcript_39575/g.101171 Transcript_39575/m.101171 type:complete len:257 (-) Transcript_39575:1424-2194(-)
MSSSQVIVAPARLWSVCSHRLLVADLVVGRHVIVLLLVRVCHLLPLAADQLAQLPKGGLRVLRLHALPHRVGEHHERGHGLLRRVLVLDLLGLLGGRLLAALGRLVGLGLALLGLGRRAAALAVRAPRHVVAGHVAAVVRVVLGRLAVVVLLAAHLEILVLFAPLRAASSTAVSARPREEQPSKTWWAQSRAFQGGAPRPACPGRGPHPWGRPGPPAPRSGCRCAGSWPAPTRTDSPTRSSGCCGTGTPGRSWCGS